MTQEDKELLLKDLSVRLPYGVRGKVKVDGVDTSKHDTDGFPLEITFDVNVELLRIDIGNDEIFVSTFDDNEDLGNYIEECQTDGIPWTINEFTPYLRPMSSITEEERNEYFDIKMQETERVAFAEVYRPEAISIIMDWLNAHHFDYRNLIKKGLALKAPKGLYKY